MLYARRSIPITGVLFFVGVLAQAGQGTWTSSGPAPAIVAVAADASAGGVIYAASGSTIYLSTDGGGSWTPGASNLRGIFTLVADPGHASSLFAGTDFGVFHSLDRGEHFAVAGLTISARLLAADATGEVLVCSDGGRNSPLHRSADGGASWTEAVGFRTAGRVAALLFDPARPNNVFAGLEGDMSYYPAIIARSADGGTSWSKVQSFNGTAGVHALASSSQGTTLYAALDGSGEGVGVSRDRGQSFQISSPLLDANISSLAVNPTSGRVYAGTDIGVFYSDDHGKDWVPLNDGLTDMRVTSLAIERDGSRVHAGTPSGVFDFDILPPAPAEPCAPDVEHLCLLGGRFRIGLSALNPRTGVVGPGTANPEGDRFGFFALPEFTGDAAFPEVLVKMVDETALPGHSFWFFYSGLTSLPYVLDVEDTTTGEVRTYQTSPDNPFCGGADTSLFPTGGVPVEASRRKASELPEGDGPSLFLLGGRFEVTLTVSDPARSRVSSGAAIPWGDRGGYFSLPEFTGDATFPEVSLKMVDFTPVSGKFWFFYTSLTHLPYTLTVTDHVTNVTRQYESPGAFCGAADTSAFAAVMIPDLSGTWTGSVRYSDQSWDLCASNGGGAILQQRGHGVTGTISGSCFNGQFDGGITDDGQVTGRVGVTTRSGSSLSGTARISTIGSGLTLSVPRLGEVDSGGNELEVGGFSMTLSR